MTSEMAINQSVLLQFFIFYEDIKMKIDRHLTEAACVWQKP